jgi:hypothetical protein
MSSPGSSTVGNSHPIELIRSSRNHWLMPKRKDEDINEAAFRVVRESTSEPIPITTAKKRKNPAAVALRRVRKDGWKNCVLNGVTRSPATPLEPDGPERNETRHGSLLYDYGTIAEIWLEYMLSTPLESTEVTT